MLDRPRLRCLALALTAAGLIVGCSGEKPETLFGRAQQYHQAGDSKAAVIELKNVLQKAPAHREARLLLGRIYVEQGDGVAAEKELRRALELGAQQEAVLPWLGRALLLEREYQKVLEEIPAAPKGSQAAVLFALRGEAYAALEDMVEARRAFEAARALMPGLPEANRGLAALLLAQGKAEQALQLADESIRDAGDKAEPWVLKGDLMRARGQNREAALAYEEAIRRNPKHLGAHLALALVRMGEKDFAGAKRYIDQARSLEPRAVPVRLAQAQLWLLEQRFDKARDELQEVLKVAPNNGLAILMMGAAQLGLNNLSQAQTYLSAFVAAIPAHAYARRLLAITYLRQRQPDKALKLVEPLLAKDPDPAVLALVGEAHLQRKDYVQAADYLEKAAQARPDQPILRTELAISRLARGQTEAGLSELEAAAKLEGSPIQTDLLLIATQLGRGEFDAALAAIDALGRKQPKLPLVPNLRGMALLGKQDTVGARRAFEAALALDPAFYPAAAHLAELDLRERNPQAARKRFEAVLAADRKNVAAMLGLAALEQAQGQTQKAVDWLTRAAQADAKAIAPRALLAQHYLAQREPQRALVLAREAQTANPENPQAVELVGNVQLAAGEIDNALATFTRLTELRPDSGAAFLRLASAQLAANRPEEARKSLTRAIEVQPDLMDAQLALIGLDMKDQRVDEATRRARALQTRYPKAAGGYLVEGDILASQNRPGEAATLYQKALEREANPVIAIKLHGSLLSAGKVAEAQAMATRWLKDHPDDVGVRLYLGDAHMKRGEDQAAIAQYRAVLKQLPDHPVALNNLAWLLNKQGDTEALPLAQRALKVRPDDPNILDTVGWIHLSRGEPNIARDFLAKAVAGAPGQPSVRYHYAVALARGGDAARARQELQRALDAGVRFPEEKDAQALLAQLKTARP
ncbi:XrtA/PEP-CTERM system TPR-repeat protein PrsT [Thiobacter aerophilum]|uniref:XrtA/PEP-CTERM system TPR-repeat protein PrsT n=1 Tax=Thiobacter aerophilum TaxID=3121275 RepID=A0ABV0ECV8_9BURK